MVLPNVFRASAAAARVLADKIRSSIAPERRYVVEFRRSRVYPFPYRRVAVPIFVPTPCIAGLRIVARIRRYNSSNPLQTNNV